MPNNPLTVSVIDACVAVGDTLAAATTIKQVRTLDDIEESVRTVNCPVLHIYPNSYVPNLNDETDRKTFGGGLRRSRLIIYVDDFPRVQGKVGRDLLSMTEDLDSISAILETQERRPFFGFEPFKSFDWSWKRATFVYSRTNYRGGRFILEFSIF